MPEDKSELERCEELFAFLQGAVPDGYTIADSHVPRMTPDQAWTVIWYLGNQYWQVPDRVERCGVCGDLFDTYSEGTCLDFGDAPYNFCGACEEGHEYRAKLRQNPELAKQHGIDLQCDDSD